MTALVVTVLVASLSGSAHCAGMCGAFVALCAGGECATPRERRLGQIAYHLGRLTTYTMLGAAAGALGSALDVGGDALLGFQRAGLVVAGAALIVFGLVVLLRHAGVPVARAPVPAVLRSLVQRALAIAIARRPIPRAALIGLFTTFLPCGWLYAFALTAAGTGSAAAGALTMAVFWLGTLPVLVALGAGVTRLAGPLRRRAPVAAALALVVVGLVSITGRFRVPALSTGGAVLASSLDGAAEQVIPNAMEPLPCCQP